MIQASYQSNGLHLKSSSPIRNNDDDKEAFRKFLEEIDSEEDQSKSDSFEDYKHQLSSQLGSFDSSDSEKSGQHF